MMDFMLDDLLKYALKEDIGTGDITTLTTVPAQRQIKGRFIAKEPGVICGLEVAARVFALLDPVVVLSFDVQEGQWVEKGDVIGTVEGSARSILSGERVALNFMQHMSGIATCTRSMVKQVEGFQTRISDTRKTTPGLRVIEKYAVQVGGGTNHRFNLADGLMIKDNHIQASGGISQAVASARKQVPHTLKIEVEVETFQQLEEALEAGADIIMLDNMSIGDMKKAVEIVAGRAVTEASGNMGQKNLRDVAATGVDIISIGALTHTVKAMDISLKF